ncbi:MAG: hypothetical protein NC489_30545 [Ruminococcus flavefaciens]|nr:hypothetical protein [Ruminococcus flavefaciens]
MLKAGYSKGTAMTFPLELTEMGEIPYEMNDKYLYPREVMKLQEDVEELCNSMERDGSVMYDEYPDKVTIERMAKKIEKGNQSETEDGGKWMRPLIQILICKEMGFRRERRRKHKDYIRSRYS